MSAARVAFAFLLWSLCGAAFAHGQSTALLQIDSHSDARGDAQPAARVQLDIALADLQQGFGLDSNADGSLTWGEIRGQAGAIEDYVRQRLVLRSGGGGEDGPCELGPADLLVDEHADGMYAVFVFTTDCVRADRAVSVDYRLFFEMDPAHHALFSATLDGRPVASGVLTQASPSASWSPGGSAILEGFASWVGEGIWHIWTGLDHILFLATLLLAAGTLGQVARIVSAFTVSHSITLICGALGWIHVESRWVEAAIALTVLFGAVNLVVPMARRRLWVLALFFGLVHGLGFASVLSGLRLDGPHLVRNLLGFNLGVEIGQLAIVLALVPLLQTQRERRWYRSAFTPGAATAIGVLATVWLFQRLA